MQDNVGYCVKKNHRLSVRRHGLGVNLYKLTVYVPDSHLEPLKQALFAAGAGRLGDYAECCWQVKGIGQFYALTGAAPFIGQIGQLEQVEEWRVEMLLQEPDREAVIDALRKNHPYQTPAFDLIKVDVGE